MRPRVFPAEDQRTAVKARGTVVASMRPRVFPAEDPQHIGPYSSMYRRFNEAAGIPPDTRKTGALRREVKVLQ